MVSPMVPSKSKATDLILLMGKIDFANNFTRISYRQTVFRNRFSYNTSCTYYASLADSNTRQDDDTSTNPAPILNGDRQGADMPDIFDSIRRFCGCQTLVQFYGMRCCIDLYVGGNQNIVSNMVGIHSEKSYRIRGFLLNS